MTQKGASDGQHHGRRWAGADAGDRAVSGFGEAERVVERERPRAPVQKSLYESVFTRMAQRRDLAQHGRIVIKGSEIPWQMNRQGKIGYYLHDDITDTALTEWRAFIHEIHTHSGKHVHQGGLGLYVLEGHGTTVIDGIEVRSPITGDARARSATRAIAPKT